MYVCICILYHCNHDKGVIIDYLPRIFKVSTGRKYIEKNVIL